MRTRAQLKDSLLLFSYETLPLILGFVLLNYFFRFLRWEYYLRVLQIRIPLSESFGIFMSSLSMAVTPGKMGEVVKAYFLKALHGIPMSKSMPIVFAERVTDFLALLIISFAGAYEIGYEKKIIVMLALVFVAGIGVISSRSTSTKIIRARRKDSLCC